MEVFELWKILVLMVNAVHCGSCSMLGYNSVACFLPSFEISSYCNVLDDSCVHSIAVSIVNVTTVFVFCNCAY